MSTAPKSSETLFPIAPFSIVEGLSDLAAAFADRNIAVASITLKRKAKSFVRTVTENATTATSSLTGTYTDTTLVVKVLSPMPAEINAELQAITTAAAASAVAWIDDDQMPAQTMVGSSATMQEVDRAITRVAKSNHVVLITGESGTGKTTAAELIHDRSPRAHGPFVDINCAAIPDTLIESELFGYEKGAFTGAAGQKKGLFEIAENGTLFLDEIGELKPELQAKLLKAIEQQKIRRLGGTKDIPCNVRILAASSRNLQRGVRNGTFREDLYYRLAVLEIYIPPLRDRQDDIEELMERQLAIESRNLDLSAPLRLDVRAAQDLVCYSWPGNIRQLQNVIARLAIASDLGGAIKQAAVRTELARFEELNSEAYVLPDSCAVLNAGETLTHYTARVRATVIEVVKNRTGNMNRAARRLDVDRASLTRVKQRMASTLNREESQTVARAA
jgi:transcriptional regulator with PAS, ATPase and Fis domain